MIADQAGWPGGTTVRAGAGAACQSRWVRRRQRQRRSQRGHKGTAAALAAQTPTRLSRHTSRALGTRRFLTHPRPHPPLPLSLPRLSASPVDPQPTCAYFPTSATRTPSKPPTTRTVTITIPPAPSSHPQRQTKHLTIPTSPHLPPPRPTPTPTPPACQTPTTTTPVPPRR